MNSVELPNIRNIAISGRIGAGATTLATRLARVLGWKMLDGGKILRKINQEAGLSVIQSNKRPDHFDLEYEEKIKRILREEKQQIIQSHLAGFDAQGIKNVFKILIICEDEEGNDKKDVRVDRLVNREGMSVEKAKEEVVLREERDLAKWRRLYAKNDLNWVYWDKKYYDLVINTYSHSQEETLKIALEGIGYQ